MGGACNTRENEQKRISQLTRSKRRLMDNIKIGRMELYRIV